MQRPDLHQRVADLPGGDDAAWAALCDELQHAQLARTRLLGAMAPRMIGAGRRGRGDALSPQDLEAMRIIQASLEDIDERMRRFIARETG